MQAFWLQVCVFNDNVMLPSKKIIRHEFNQNHLLNSGHVLHWAKQELNFIFQKDWAPFPLGVSLADYSGTPGACFGLGRSRKVERALDQESYNKNRILILAPSSTLTLGYGKSLDSKSFFMWLRRVLIKCTSFLSHGKVQMRNQTIKRYQTINSLMGQIFVVRLPLVQSTYSEKSPFSLGLCELHPQPQLASGRMCKP